MDRLVGLSAMRSGTSPQMMVAVARQSIGNLLRRSTRGVAVVYSHKAVRVGEMMITHVDRSGFEAEPTAAERAFKRGLPLAIYWIC